SDITRFRDREGKELARSTANLSLKILRVCFGEAVRQGLLTINPAVRVKLLKSSKESKRRPFTLSEIKRVLKACGDDQQWRSLVLLGLYLGQRLGDLQKLTWRAANLESDEIAFTARKTDRRVVLPLVQPLSDYLASLPMPVPSQCCPMIYWSKIIRVPRARPRCDPTIRLISVAPRACAWNGLRR